MSEKTQVTMTAEQLAKWEAFQEAEKKKGSGRAPQTAARDLRAISGPRAGDRAPRAPQPERTD